MTLMTKRKITYLRYLESDHWKSLRAEAFRRDCFKCVRCGSRNHLRGHHKRYRKDLQLCTVNDIETMCQSCHNSYHKMKKEFRRFKPKPTKLAMLMVLLIRGAQIRRQIQ